MPAIHFIEHAFALAIALSPLINEVGKTICLAKRLQLLERYGIIKPTRR